MKRAVLTALPGVALGLAGLFHPAHLTTATSHRWWVLHVVGMFVFPLVGVAVASLVWPRRSPLAVAVVVLAFVWGTAYNALDILAGMAAGYLVEGLDGRSRAVSLVFRLAHPFGDLGAWALIAAAALLVVDGWRRVGALGALGGTVVLAGAVLVSEFHIYPPWGSLGIALVGVGCGVAALGVSGRPLRSSA